MQEPKLRNAASTIEAEEQSIDPASAVSVEPEVDIDAVKAKIREAVARREAEGRTQFIEASAALSDLLFAKLAESSDLSLSETEAAGFLALQPDFSPNPDGYYQLADLLKYHDAKFIWNAYVAILKREPDEPGLNAYLERLRSGRWNKVDVLGSLRFSPEGRRHNVTIEGLKGRAMFRRLYRLPLIGYVLELVVDLARLPSLIHSDRAMGNYLIGQQERTAAHLNDTAARINDRYDALRRDAIQTRETLETQQKEIARTQHQQMSALFLMLQKAARATANNGGGLRSTSDEVFDEIYANFEDEFRGDFEDVKNNFRIYLDVLSEAHHTDGILDLGSGRGEWLELLGENGYQARGVESNRVLAQRGRTRGLAVIESDALAYLRRLPDSSLNVVTAFHFVEHLDPGRLIQLMSEIHRTLKPEGLFLVETPNPKNLVVGACNFYSDPTHRQPLFPETLQFLIEQLGFTRTRLQYLHAVEDSPFTDSNEGSQALNSWLFSARDYSIVASKPTVN